ncbi:hypothetical protein FN846DRAFT_1013847 [Sphaerosporella brunnea]|uniref:Uncharacterized protein n=1 Tax=Sphaerosporella brunnea TaxID=1250544 RepID=A0A5J5FA80_9PEZI|nr:hypothetical protein FN846DRAFT_1013847 [Sphaerosporella brunnea]
MQRAEGKTTVYTSRGIRWELKARVVDGLREFLGSPEWYQDRGIPYRRGYLLYGLQGTGKTPFVKAIAGYLDYNICLINLSERGLTDDRLNYLLSNLPERSIALFGDVDAAFANRRQVSEDVYSGANVVMRCEQTEGLTHILIEILRGGKLFEAGHHGVTTAELQGLFLFFKTDPEAVVKAAGQLFKKLVEPREKLGVETATFELLTLCTLRDVSSPRTLQSFDNRSVGLPSPKE